MKNIAKLLAGWVVALAIAWAAHRYLPHEHNRLQPLDLDDPIGIATYDKLTAVKHDSEACFALMDRSGVQHRLVDQSRPGRNCGFYNALTLDPAGSSYDDELSMTCALAATLAVWERQSARPLAERLLGSPIVRIETYGTFACRPMRGSISGRMSEHALANAIDIWGFRLKDGRLISVKTHWDSEGPESKFLKRVHRDACRLFSVTLGPEFNAAHEDHFHLDLGSGDVCR
ncbi:MAG: extensin family protein [Pseudomonadota bacterium]